MPKEYYKYVYIFENETIEGLKNAIIKLIDTPREELIEKGKQAQGFVLINKNNIIQTRKIVNMIIKL